MKKDPVDVAQASYRRCCEAPDFFTAFYADFFATCPEAQPIFAKTNFRKQHRLLKHGVGLLINFNHEPDDEPNILTRVAERHRRGDLAVHPRLYPFFLESLITTARKYDTKFNTETETAWREATAKGIAYMSSKY
jgi:hemoglobin-like flavoprotein